MFFVWDQNFPRITNEMLHVLNLNILLESITYYYYYWIFFFFSRGNNTFKTNKWSDINSVRVVCLTFYKMSECSSVSSNLFYLTRLLRRDHVIISRDNNNNIIRTPFGINGGEKKYWRKYKHSDGFSIGKISVIPNEIHLCT